MTVCERVRAEAAGLAALPRGDPDRAAAAVHAAHCPGCARALREAERLQAVLGEWHPEAVPAAVLGRAARAIEDELRGEARRRSLWSMVAAAAFMVGLVALSRHRGGTALDWATAAVLGALALLLAAVAGRRPALTVASAAVASLAAALVAGGPGPLEAALGVECMVYELGAAAVVLGGGWLVLRGGTSSFTRSTLAAAAAAGALAGDAALQVVCGAHEFAPHLLAFHVGGVLLAASVGAVLWRPGRTAPA